LYDAYTGAIRGSYRPYNALDELESPVVATFSHNGTKLATGGFRTDRTLHVFDVGIPGRDSTVLRLGKTRRSSDGQKGMASALAYSADDKYLAVGTYAPGSIYVYDCRQEQPSGTVMSNSGLCVVGHGKNHGRKKRRLASVEKQSGGILNEEEGSENVKEEGSSWISSAKSKWYHARVQGGVTQLLFSPHEHYLFSTSRRSGSVLMWDLRMLSDNPDHDSIPVSGMASYSTANDTNQRLEFDLDDTGEALLVGGNDGRVRIYSTSTGELVGSIVVGGAEKEPANGVSFAHVANRKLLAVATGARRFPSDDDDSDLDRAPLQSIDSDKTSNPPGFLRLYEFLMPTDSKLRCMNI
jgi:telomerase Cajal body protein 1